MAVSILSSFSQLSAEIEGRGYGSGVLKHEPSEARRIRVLIPANLNAEQIAIAFKTVDDLLRKGLRREAQNAADEFVMQEYSPYERLRHVSALRKALAEMRRRRQRPSKYCEAADKEER